MTFDESISAAQGRIQGAYTAVSEMGGTVPSELSQQTTYNLPSSIKTIPKSLSLHKYAVQSDIEWNDEWQARGLSGTVFDVVVGDNLAPRLSVEIVVGNLAANDPATIYWGDGTSSTMANNTTETRVYHKYLNAGHYELRVDDKAKRVYFMSSLPIANTLNNLIVYDTRNAIRRLQQIGSKVTSVAYMCMYLTWCNSNEGGYPGYLPAIPVNVTSLEAAFAYLNYYSEDKVPRIDHLARCNTASQVFKDMYNCRADVQKLPPNIKNALMAYSGWRLNKYIPYDVFEQTNQLTNTYGVFQFNYEAVGEFPVISNLTATTTMAFMFNGCLQIGAGHDNPVLPDAVSLTSMQSFMCECGNATGANDLNICQHCLNVSTIRDAFYNCRGLRCRAEIPQSISVTDGLYRAYANCFGLSGAFPSYPTSYVGSLYQTFYSCYSLSGQLPDFPIGANNIFLTYGYCYNATGKFPSLGHLTAFNGTDSVKGTFIWCNNITEPPDTFISPAALNASTANNFTQMFAYCNKLTNWPHPLTGYTKITNTQEMFRECRSLSSAAMEFAPNLTTGYYMYYYCNALTSNIPQWGAKMVNALCIYLQADSLGQMLDADGNVETTASKIYNSKLTAYTNLANGASPKVQKQFYDALVASGKSGTLYGNVNATWE